MALVSNLCAHWGAWVIYQDLWVHWTVDRKGGCNHSPFLKGTGVWQERRNMSARPIHPRGHVTLSQLCRSMKCTPNPLRTWRREAGEGYPTVPAHFLKNKSSDHSRKQETWASHGSAGQYPGQEQRARAGLCGHTGAAAGHGRAPAWGSMPRSSKQ